MTHDVSTSSASILSSTPRRRRFGFGLLGYIVGTVVIGGMLVSILLPSLCKAREPANRSKCASNLHQIGLAILLYTQENNGQYPPSLAVAMEKESLTPAVMICPSSNDETASAPDSAGILADITAAENNAANHKHCLSYVYVSRGMTVAGASPKAVVAYEPLQNHQGDGTNVLFGDGHAEWISKQEWPKIAAAAGLPISATVMPTMPAATRP